MAPAIGAEHGRRSRHSDRRCPSIRAHCYAEL